MLQRFRRLDARLHSTALAIAVVAAFGAPTVAAAQGALTRPGEAMATCPTDPVGLALCLKRPVSPPPPAPPAMVGETDSSGEDSSGVESVVVTGSRIEPSSSITNNQEAGVDEGGIVKNRGDLLVILRRGRLFTVSTAGGTLRPIHAVDAFAPGVRPDADDDWYDEMLVAGDQVIVIGYSYRRGGTEINRFHLDATGRLSFRDAHHLQSSDYYSSENYASRLVGSRLVFYAPLGLDEELDGAIGLRRWQGACRRRFARSRARVACSCPRSCGTRQTRRSTPSTIWSAATCWPPCSSAPRSACWGRNRATSMSRARPSICGPQKPGPRTPGEKGRAPSSTGSR
jgi:hypothetical protein